MLRTLIVAAVFTVALAQVTPPVWPETFHSSFVESYPNKPYKIPANIWYDSNRATMRVDRADG